MLKFVIRESVLGYLCFKRFLLLFYDVDDSSVLGCALLNKSCISRCELLSGNFLAMCLLWKLNLKVFRRSCLSEAAHWAAASCFLCSFQVVWEGSWGVGRNWYLRQEETLPIPSPVLYAFQFVADVSCGEKFFQVGYLFCQWFGKVVCALPSIMLNFNESKYKLR